MKAFYPFIFLLTLHCTPKKETGKINKTSEIARETSKSQNSECRSCNSDEDTDTVFIFKNKKRVLICGYAELVEKEKVFSEFSLYECSKDSIAGFWDAVENYKIEFVNDTLKLKNVELLALGKNEELINEEWLTEYFYYNTNGLNKRIKINPKVKYKQDQIKQTITDYEKTNWQTQNSGITEAYGEEKMALANKLMISAISGNSKAEEYFKDFESKFQPDGAYAEWYDEMAAMLAFAKQRK